MLKIRTGWNTSSNSTMSTCRTSITRQSGFMCSMGMLTDRGRTISHRDCRIFLQIINLMMKIKRKPKFISTDSWINCRITLNALTSSDLTDTSLYYSIYIYSIMNNKNMYYKWGSVKQHIYMGLGVNSGCVFIERGRVISPQGFSWGFLVSLCGSWMILSSVNCKGLKS